MLRYVSPQMISTERTIALSWLTTRPETIDPLFKDSLLLINQRSIEVVTRYSCQGHADKKHYPDPYVQFLCTKAGEEELTQFYFNYMNVAQKLGLKALHYVRLSRTCKPGGNEKQDINKWLPVFIWAYRVQGDSLADKDNDRKIALEAFCIAVELTWHTPSENN